MARPVRFVRAATAACLAAAVVGACGGGRDGNEEELPVTSQVVSDATTQDVQVMAPEAAGPWPVVVALHGLRGSGEDMVELGTRIARAGAVVFAPSYRSDLTTAEGLRVTTDDIVCGYQLARRTAAAHGGDLTRPVTAVGWSLGADLVLLGSLGGPADDQGRCPGDVPDPDVVVGLSGCYYEFEGRPVTWFDDPTAWGNKDIDIYLVDGEEDATCPPWQTERFAAALKAQGYHVEVVQLRSASHSAPVFHEDRDGRWQVRPDDPAGEQAVRIVLDAIASAADVP